MQKILALYGTRPEAIKTAPVVEALRRRAGQFAVTVATTAQHRELLDQSQELLGLRPDVDLDLMRPDQTPNELAARLFAALDPLLAETAPDWLLVQGDTTTAFAGAWAAFHRRVRVGHVEAGLRTGDLAQPFPEEANRRAIDLLADALFAPTARARGALLGEGVPAERVHLTGNTVVDALERIAERLPEAPAPDGSVLITLHRRESFGAPLAGILAALRELALAFPAVRFVYPVHPNPNVRGPAHRTLSGLANFELHEPFDYLEMVRRLRSARLVMTDSGGLQEEAPAFGKPVLVLRDKTERPEGIEAGVAQLAGTDPARIAAAASRLLTDEDAWRAMTAAVNPYGDGRAGERIAGILAGETIDPFPPDRRDIRKFLCNP
jgi:UDP-N-acetylglucosamine 2-epimerase (non-hydrolysing)